MSPTVRTLLADLDAMLRTGLHPDRIRAVGPVLAARLPLIIAGIFAAPVMPDGSRILGARLAAQHAAAGDHVDG